MIGATEEGHGQHFLSGNLCPFLDGASLSMGVLCTGEFHVVNDGASEMFDGGTPHRQLSAVVVDGLPLGLFAGKEIVHGVHESKVTVATIVKLHVYPQDTLK